MQSRSCDTEPWLVALAYAYSGQWNPRRLEHHFHGIWHLVFNNLIHDLTPHMFLIPQYMLDTVHGGPVTADTSIATTAEASAKEVTPDFSIIATQIQLRNNGQSIPPALIPQDVVCWHYIKVTMAKTPLISELKRPPTRHAPSLDSFIFALKASMLSATNDLDIQASAAFINQPTLKNLVLVACCGEWWCWKVMRRDDALTNPSTILFNLNMVDKEEPEETTTVNSWVRPAKKLAKRGLETTKRYLQTKEGPPESWEVIPPYTRTAKNDQDDEPGEDLPMRYTDLGVQNMEAVHDDIENAFLGPNEWSGNILLGSQASNQQFFLIHRLIKVVMSTDDVEYAASKASDSQESEDSEDSEGIEGIEDNEDNEEDTDDDRFDNWDNDDDNDGEYEDTDSEEDDD